MLGELDREQIDRVLHSEVVGRIGCHADGRTYVVPITYVYDGECVYGHSHLGMKIEMMRQNPAVCFQVDHLDNLANWQSVVAWGRYEELDGQEAHGAMTRLMKRVTPLLVSESAVPSHGLGGHRVDTSGKEVIVFRIRLAERTGRFEKRG